MKVLAVFSSGLAIGLYAVFSITFVRLYLKYVTQEELLEQYSKIHWAIGDFFNEALKNDVVPFTKVTYKWFITLPYFSILAFNYLNEGIKFHNIAIICAMLAEQKLHLGAGETDWLYVLAFNSLAAYCFAKGQKFTPMGYFDIPIVLICTLIGVASMFIMSHGFPHEMYNTISYHPMTPVSDYMQQVGISTQIFCLVLLNWRTMARMVYEASLESGMFMFGQCFYNVGMALLVTSHYGLGIKEPLTLYLSCNYFALFCMTMGANPSNPEEETLAEMVREEEEKEPKVKEASKKAKTSKSTEESKKKK